jgi:DNA-binding transcriptional ArsR family regulator
VSAELAQVRLTATDRETIRVLGHALVTVGDLAKVTGIRHTAAYQRLERLRTQGVVVRHDRAGTKAALYEVRDPAGRAAALIAAVTPELPPGEAAWFAGIVQSGHRCVACGGQHAACCGLCPHWRSLPGEGARTVVAD